MELSQIINKKLIIAGKSFPAITIYLRNQLPEINLKVVKQKELIHE